MPVEQIVPGLYSIPLGFVNAFFIDEPGAGVLIDTGFPGNANKILSALQALDKQPGDVKHILLTHTHADHIGNAAALKKATGARTYMHPQDAPIAEAGTGFRPMRAAPGLLNRAITALVHFRIVTLKMKVDPCAIDRRVEDGEVLPPVRRHHGGARARSLPGPTGFSVAASW